MWLHPIWYSRAFANGGLLQQSARSMLRLEFYAPDSDLVLAVVGGPDRHAAAALINLDLNACVPVLTPSVDLPA
jgi:hypothetical protein